LRQSPRRRIPPDWSARLLIALAAGSVVSGAVGFRVAGVRDLWDVAYLTLQLFFLNFDGDGLQMNPWLQMARFGALFTAVWAILKAFFPQVRQHIRRFLRSRGKSCAVVLGYGAVGQAIGAALWQRDCGIARVTAVHPSVTPELAARARADGVLLIEGDASDPRVLKRIYVAKAERIYISDPDDLRAIDTAVAVRQHLGDRGNDIRIVLNDSDVAAQMAEATVAGFLGATGLRWFSVADETARLLIADARFDRVALESGAERMHLVVVGGGSQGEAVAVEAILTAWRTGLGPPKITFFDRDVASVEARLRRRMPAWFLQANGGALYPAARPDLAFLECDAKDADFMRDSRFDGLRARVSGWVFAMGDDAKNLRASIELHRAIMARHIDPAPIYVRIPTGHAEDAPELSANPLGLAQTFGSIESVIARSALLAEDPDAVPKVLHDAYRKAEQEMFGRFSEDWESLPENKREANRALFRHAVMKIEDFGAVATVGRDGVPLTHAGLAATLRRVDESLAYDRIDQGGEARRWLRDGAALSKNDLATAVLIRNAALCEHNRWTIERALAQFLPTTRPDRALRDDVRRIHNNMHDWFDLEDAETRRYDLVMLHALLSQRAAAGQVLHKAARVKTVFLAVDGLAKTCTAHFSRCGMAEGSDVSELHLHMNSRNEPATPAELVPVVMSCLAPHIDRQKQHLPTRIRFDFRRQPSERVLVLANLVAMELREKLSETTQIDAFWNWRAAGSPVAGVVGHRDLTAFGGIVPITEQLRQTFMDLVIGKGVAQLVTGYAPGSDRAAVEAWASLAFPKPLLIFPFSSRDATGEDVYFTEEPELATWDTTISERAALEVGRPMLSASGGGHVAQAEEILRVADLTVFVVDETRSAVTGGSGDTLERARLSGVEMVLLSPAP